MWQEVGVIVDAGSWMLDTWYWILNGNDGIWARNDFYPVSSIQYQIANVPDECRKCGIENRG